MPRILSEISSNGLLSQMRTHNTLRSLLNPSHGVTEDLRRVDRLVNKYTFVFMLVIDNFVDDPFYQMMQDELIMTTICSGG